MVEKFVYKKDVIFTTLILKFLGCYEYLTE